MTIGTGRSSQLRDRLTHLELDALIVTTPTNIRYLTGFTGSNGVVVVTADATTLVTDSRYTAWAGDEVAAHDATTEIRIAPGQGRGAIEELVDAASMVGLESAHVTWAEADAFAEMLGSERVLATTDLIEGLREQKSAAEIALLQRAAEVGDAALALLVEELRPGLTEIEVARQLAQHMYTHSGVSPSFDIIVATGPNSAKPHHEPTSRPLATGDLVIIDSGASVDGYLSDMTRSFVLGTPNSQQREMLDVVREAQQAGVDVAGPGVPASEVDATCRGFIAEAGLGAFFTHGTGHGVGLDIHESPSVSSASTATLAPGHIITVEPGVYIPEVGGVRWEDTVVVTTNGADALTRSPKQPIVEL